MALQKAIHEDFGLTNKTMKTVFILYHSYDLEGCEETKLIGVYSSKDEADQAVTRLKDKNGFKYRPDAFVTSEYDINQDHWTEGFATVASIQVKRKDNSWMTVIAECLPNDTYQIREDEESESLGEFKNLDIVECEEREGCLYAIKLVRKGDA